MNIDNETEYTETLSDIIVRNQVIIKSSGTHYSKNIHQDLEMASAYVNCIRDSSTKDNISLHSHSFHEILLVESGNIQYLLGDEIYNIQRDNLIIIPAGVSHRPMIPKNFTGIYSRIALWISTKFLDSIYFYRAFKKEYGISPSQYRSIVVK